MPGLGLVPASGSGRNGVLLVFEAAGADEVTAGEPLRGKAGFAFHQMLQRAGLDRDDFRIANVLACRPPDNKLRGEPYERQVIEYCSPILDAEINRMRPRAIVAGGAIAFERLLPEVARLPKVGLMDSKKARGARGYAFWSERYSTWVIPTVHPAHILRGKTHLTSVFIHDVQKAVGIASDGYAYDVPSYLLDPTQGDLAAWVRDFSAWVAAHPGTRLSTDIETPLKGDDEEDVDLEDASYTLLRVGFAFRPLEALSIPWQAQYIPAIKHLVEAPCDHLWWHGAYDQPRLRANGMSLGGVQHDGMVAWHLLHSDLPKSLNFVTTFCCPRQRMWKHLSAGEPAFYNAADADTAGRNMTRTEEEMRKAGLAGLYDHHVIRFNPIRSEMSAAGMPIDPHKRLAFALELDRRLGRVRAAMQEIVPLEAKRVDPKGGFVRPPADVEGMTTIKVTTFVARCDRCGLLNPTKPHFAAHGPKKTKMVGPNHCEAAKKVLLQEVVERFARVVEFVPSQPQMMSYLAVRKHQPVFEGRGADRHATTNEKAIKILIGKYPKDPLYPVVLEFRELQKLAGTYIGNIEWESVEVPDDYVPAEYEVAC